MTEIFTNTKISILLATALSLFLSSYIFFTSYRPKALRELRDVKGLSTQTNIFSLPQVPDAENISINKTFDSQQTTFLTQKTPAEVQSFYENILADEWLLKEETLNDNFFARQYKKDDSFVYIWASENIETNNTYASVEILNHEK